MIAMRLAMLVLLPAVSGCAGLALAGAGGSAFGQGKTPVDHTISWIEGKDCSLIRSHEGLTYCVEDEALPTYRGHCFRTLGEITCYTEEQPFPGHQAPVGSARPNAAKPSQDLAAANTPLAPTPSNTN